MPSEENIKLIFGIKLKHLRLKKLLLPQQLAEKAGISNSYLNEIEKGEKYPKTDKINALAAALQVKYDDLVSLKLPKEFAAFLLQDTSNYSYAKIDSICKKRQTKSIPMKRHIDVHVVYLTNSLDSAGNVVFLKDVYGLDSKMN